MNAAVTAIGLELAERGWLRDAVVRLGIRRQCERHARRLAQGGWMGNERRLQAFLDAARSAPVALHPDRANRQHYEVPAAFFREVLGPHCKYSCCWWPAGVASLAEAEAAALAATCERARLGDGQRILELGCGWGALTLWMARHFPGSEIVAISNSSSQRAHILGEADRRGYSNVEVRTLDMNDFRAGRRFDRVVSVEMFEHLRNWERVFREIARSLEPDGRFFLHVFCHRIAAYAYETDGPGDWMGRHFFAGGMMPSADYPRRLETPFEVEAEWTWDGTHYGRTAEAWLENLDRRRAAVMPLLAATYGAADAGRWLGRWRMFFLACAEMFGLRGGSEWRVGHYRLAPRGARPVRAAAS